MDTASNRTLLITGGRGFIGRAVGKLLRRAGYRVVSVDTTAISAGDDCESVRNVICDIGDADALRRVFEARPIGGIVHLAAILPTAAAREPAQAMRVNVDGSVHVLELAQRFRVRRVVFGSSLSVYGTCAADRVVSETHAPAPEDLYGAAKLHVERMGQTYRDRHGIEFVSLRIGRVVGPGARSVTSAWRSEIFEFLRARSPVATTVPYVASERILLAHVDDVARMLVALLGATSPAHAVYNAVCESVVVADLKWELEALNSNIRVRLGDALAAGNPRLLEDSRFKREFDFETLPIFEQLKRATEN